MCHTNKVVLVDKPSSVPISSLSNRGIVAASMLA